MSRHNAFDDVTSAVVKEIQDYSARAKKSRVVPMGMEEVSASVAKHRVKQMNPAQRQQLIDTVGLPKAMEMIGDGR